MKFSAVAFGMAAFLAGGVAQSAESPQTKNTLPDAIQLAAETHEQKCNRWANIEGVKDKDRAEFIKFCLIDLSVPDKPLAAGGD